MIIAVDFDGTIVEHKFPEIGAPLPGVFPWLRAWQDAGARLILYTMRSDDREDGRNYLTEAVEFCRQHGIEFWAVNQNPEQHTWTKSPKVYAQMYVDDAAFGCPVVSSNEGRPSVDWSRVGPAVLDILRMQKEAA
jgi:hypothetical protein